MTSTILKGRKTVKLGKRKTLWRFLTDRKPTTYGSFYAYGNYKSDVRKKTADFIEKHRKAFDYLSKH